MTGQPQDTKSSLIEKLDEAIKRINDELDKRRQMLREYLISVSEGEIQDGQRPPTIKEEVDALRKIVYELGEIQKSAERLKPFSIDVAQNTTTLQQISEGLSEAAKRIEGATPLDIDKEKRILEKIIKSLDELPPDPNLKLVTFMLRTQAQALRAQLRPAELLISVFEMAAQELPDPQAVAATPPPPPDPQAVKAEAEKGKRWLDVLWILAVITPPYLFDRFKDKWQTYFNRATRLTGGIGQVITMRANDYITRPHQQQLPSTLIHASAAPPAARPPILTYVAVVVGLFALLAGVLALIQGTGSMRQVASLQQTLTALPTLMDTLTPFPADVEFTKVAEALDQKIAELQQAITAIPTDLPTLPPISVADELTKIAGQFTQTPTPSQTPTPLPTDTPLPTNTPRPTASPDIQSTQTVIAQTAIAALRATARTGTEIAQAIETRTAATVKALLATPTMSATPTITPTSQPIVPPLATKRELQIIGGRQNVRREPNTDNDNNIIFIIFLSDNIRYSIVCFTRDKKWAKIRFERSDRPEKEGFINITVNPSSVSYFENDTPVRQVDVPTFIDRTPKCPVQPDEIF